MNLSDEEKAIGQDNFRRVTGQLLADSDSRRDFLKEVSLTSAVAVGGFGGAYWGYGNKLDNPLRIGIIGTGDEGNVLIGALNPEFVEVKAIADIRPYSIHRAFHGDAGNLKARPGLMEVFGYKTEDEARDNIEVFEDYNDLLEEENIDAVIIALPLWLHHPAAVKAMQKGKHVLTEKLMAWSVGQCKEMARVAEVTGKLLATGHQRHYSVLYDNAVSTIRRGLIGDIHHIRAQWHRGNLPGKDSWQPPLPTRMMSPAEIAAAEKKAKADGGKAGLNEWRAEHKLVRELAAWNKKLRDPKLKKSEIATWEKKVAQKEAQLRDFALNAADWDYEDATIGGVYERPAIEELIRWRIWNRTGGGLMAELGSHQLDASGIFISSQFEGKVKVNPLSVTAVGGRHTFPLDRDADDHVYASYEYPAKGYFEDNDPKKAKADENKKCVVTYSSINGNGFGGYGEVVMGTDGTLILEREKDVLLYAGSKTGTKVALNEDKDALVDSYETGGGYTPAAQAVTQEVSRGYKEEIEHWAKCIQEEAPPETLHCHPKVALADAVIALTTNLAIKEQRRIEFEDDWFDPNSDAVPCEAKPRKASDIKV